MTKHNLENRSWPGINRILWIVAVLLIEVVIVTPVQAKSIIQAPNTEQLKTLKAYESRKNLFRDFLVELNQLSDLASSSPKITRINEEIERALEETTKSTAAAKHCLELWSIELQSSSTAVAMVELNIEQSVNALKAVASAKDSQVLGKAIFADNANERRIEAEHQLNETSQILYDIRQQCVQKISQSDWGISTFPSVSGRLIKAADKLPKWHAQIHTRIKKLILDYNAASEKHLFNSLAVLPAMPSGQSLRKLQKLLNDSPASMRDSGSNSLLTATPAVRSSSINSGLVPIMKELSQLEDAASYIDLVLGADNDQCKSSHCQSFRSERDQIGFAIQDARKRLNASLSELKNQPGISADSLQALSENLASQQRWHKKSTLAVKAAVTEFEAVKRATEQTISDLSPSISTAYEHAQSDWENIYQQVYGEAPVDDIFFNDKSTLEAETHPAMAAPAMVKMPDLRDHAYEVISNIDSESTDFGAYTYVLVRNAKDLKIPAVKSRFDQLLKTVSLTVRASEVESGIKQNIHLFCIPGSETNIHPELKVNYDSRLGNQIKLRATSGVLTRSKMKAALTKSPGPFLITLPSRISESRHDSPLLFADLSPYSKEVIHDLVTSYMTGLMKKFPQEKRQWKPPVTQQVAMTLITLASDTGRIIANVFPTALAEPGN